MAKRNTVEDLGRADNAATTLEIKQLEDLTASVARSSPHVKTLNISCFVKAADPSGLPAHGMSMCRDTAARIPFFVILFPELEEAHLGGTFLVPVMEIGRPSTPPG